MKRTLFAWALLIAIATLWSCRDDESTGIDAYTKQTILVYMPWSGTNSNSGLYHAFLDNLDSIESAIKAKKGLADSRLVVFISRSATQSELYEVTYENAQCKHTPLKTYQGADYTTAAGLARIISDAKDMAPALNYAMIIGCHGTGWPPKDAWQNYPNNAKQYLFDTRQSTPRPIPTRFFGSVADMHFATDIDVLAEAIKLSATQMQFILFDDCYMANIETAYALSDVTNFLIASTSEVIYIGMPYATMWSSLASATPNYAKALSAFYDFYSKYTVPCGTLSAIDCREVKRLAAIMQEINRIHTFDTSLLDSIQILDGFKQGIFYDLGDYVTHLCTNKALNEQFQQQLSRVIKGKVHTDSIYSYLYTNEGGKKIAVKTFSGLTISDPSQHIVVRRSADKTGWWKATH